MEKFISLVGRLFTAAAKRRWLNRLDRAAVRWLKLSEKAAKQKIVVDNLLQTYNQRYPDDKIHPHG